MSKHYPPEFQAKQFNCVYCGVYAHQNWKEIAFYNTYNQIQYLACICSHCSKLSLWKNNTKNYY